MLLITHLRSVCVAQKCLKLTLLQKQGFHLLSRPQRYNPPAGTRSFFYKLFGKPSQHRLKVADDIPETYELIYRNTMTKYIVGSQIVSFITGGIIIMGLLLRSEYENNREGSTKWSPTSRATEGEETYFIAFFVIFLVLLQTMVSRMPLRIYKVPGAPKYIAINFGALGKKRFSFLRGQLFYNEGRGLLPWSANKYVLVTETEQRPLILMDMYFRRPADFNIMLGEQRDPDQEDETK